MRERDPWGWQRGATVLPAPDERPIESIAPATAEERAAGVDRMAQVLAEAEERRRLRRIERAEPSLPVPR